MINGRTANRRIAEDKITPRYSRELALLPEVFNKARIPLEDLVKAVKTIGHLPARYVGSGGSLAVAQLAADLHKSSTRTSAWSTTPLLSIHEPAPPQSAFVLFSSRGKNPDAVTALAAARAAQHDPVMMVSQYRLAEMPRRIQHQNPTVLTVDAPPDGFLATGSVLATSTALVAAHGHQLPNADDLNWEFPPSFDIRRRLLVLYGWGLENVARDIETRLTEQALASVQLTDYRNFAHGRHVGFSRNISATSVLALIDPQSTAIAERTLSELPAESDIARISSQFRWPVSSIDLLVRSCRIPLLLAESDPARPSVPPFGRKLYHLPVARILKRERIGPVDRKLAAGSGVHDRDQTTGALHRWLKYSKEQDITGLVLDYDGTCCATEARFKPPPVDVQEGIVHALTLGLKIGFASGRGKSLPESLRKWLPEEYWPQIILGLYNGSLSVHLDEQLNDQTSVLQPFNELAIELSAEFADSAKIEARSTQISIRSSQCVRGTEMLPTVRAVIARHGKDYKAYASAHSVDVIYSNHSKASLVKALSESSDGSTAVLAIGDCGSETGNDFELLAATKLSLSVDQVSPDLSRCWNLDTRGEKGPELLSRYLKCLRFSVGKIRFVWESNR